MAEKKTKAQEEMEELKRMNAELTKQLTAFMAGHTAAANRTQSVAVGAQFRQVGIRNISSYTVGITSPVKGEPDVHLAAAHDAQNPLPASRTTISYPFWQMIRNGPFVAKGYIIRDDSILGDTDLVAPPDDERDLPEERKVNGIEDPFAWIESRTEDEIRRDLALITSDASIRRLLAAVDFKIREVGEQWAGQEDRGKRALRALPSRYHIVDEFGKERLDELMYPNRDRSEETNVTAQF